jgi:glycosyltransferase involved in cell wall biosynthesis
MKYSITIFCPDKHLMYDGRTPDTKGVGGGVTARIKLGKALAANGHQVTLICNCPRSETYQGVKYVPVDQATKIDSDILICSTSGDKLNLTPLLKLDVRARLRILWAHGIPYPGATAEINPDYVYPPSNFIRKVVLNDWKISPEKIFTAHHGISKTYFRRSYFEQLLNPRNPYRIAYAGNPLKGLNAAIGTLRLLRLRDSRYHLHVFGDERLWGAKKTSLPKESGVRYFGIMNQKQLPKMLQSCNFTLNLQALLEAFGITMVESLFAGCIVLASPVGAYAELIKNNENGFLVPGDLNSPETWAQAARVILNLSEKPAEIERIRNNATNGILDWSDVATTYEQHWDYLLGEPEARTFLESGVCPECHAQGNLHLLDGYHCVSCGNYWNT